VPILVEGMVETVAAYKALGGEAAKGFVSTLKDAAEPVRDAAASKATSEIRNMGTGRWHEMKVGVTGRQVYVAPSARRRGGSPRSNLAGLLMNRAMEPALDEKTEEILQRVEAALTTMSVSVGF
jgi:hypothetical protein